MTHSAVLTLARDALKSVFERGVFASQCRIALAAIDAELAASADAGRQDDEPDLTS